MKFSDTESRYSCDYYSMKLKWLLYGLNVKYDTWKAACTYCSHHFEKGLTKLHLICPLIAIHMSANWHI